ncbi:MAG TPA: META domain-containing protein [Gemmatimonadales bacterium]
MTGRTGLAELLATGWLLGLVHCKPAPEKPANTPPSNQETAQSRPTGLGGTSWRLVQFQGGDGSSLNPDDPAKYTIAFATDGRLSVRIDCNRGTSTWKSSEPTHLELGPLGLTRAMCPPGSLHDQIVKQWPYVRSYVMKDGHLFVSLMADGGIYEFEPLKTETQVPPESLENTYWKLTRLGDASVAEAPNEPHFILNPGTRRVGGSGGCNRLTGSYELNGKRLSLDSMATTLMACSDGMETERAFLDALLRVTQWRIAGQELELLDKSDKTIARFEARQME